MSSPQKESKPTVQWYVGMSAEEKAQFEVSLMANRNNVVILRMLELVTAKLYELNNQSEEAYDNAGWPFLQADVVGQKRGLRYIRDLFKFTNADQVKDPY